MNVVLEGLKISAIAAVIPQDLLKIEDLYDKFGQNNVDRISASTGIESIGIVKRETNTSELCIQAAKKIFSSSIKSDNIDAVVFVSQTPDYVMPSTACIIQNKLNLKNDIVAFDINYGCSGYIYGLYQAALLISSTSCRKVLLCAGDTISRYIDPDDHKVRMLLGDAGTATIIEEGNDSWAFDIHTDGSGFDKLIIPKNSDYTDGNINMDGVAVMEFALRVVPSSIDSVLNMKSWKKEKINNYFLHQPNEFMLKYLQKKMKLSEPQVPIAVKNYGNTGPASIPLTICHYYSNSNKNLGDSILSGFGVGLSWGSIALNLSNTTVYKPFAYEL
ncbi:ketoacyl-ACP synthase III [Legionella sp. CNM-4043-24]|uniref:ketoacyl-ACP synthase III n=1 Tax=Legionella sp. CNM-4043-24 TaxID=3421646 RepID=UPI00403AA972